MTVSNIDMDKRGEIDFEDPDSNSKGRTESRSVGGLSSSSSIHSKDSEEMLLESFNDGVKKELSRIEEETSE